MDKDKIMNVIENLLLNVDIEYRNIYSHCYRCDIFGSYVEFLRDQYNINKGKELILREIKGILEEKE